MKRGMLRAYSAGFTALSRVADVVLVIGGGLLAYTLRFRRVPDALPLSYVAVIVIAALLAALLFPLLGVYRSWRARGLRAPVGQVLLSWAAVFALILLMLVLVKKNDLLSRAWMALWFLSTAAALLLLRVGLYMLLHALRARGYNLRKAVIVGCGAQAQVLLQRARDPQWAGFEVAAVFDPGMDACEVGGIAAQPLDGLGAYVADNAIDEVWVSLPLAQSALLEPVLAQLRNSTANVRYVPDMLGLFLLNHGVTEVLDTPMLDLTATPMQGFNRALKRAEDVLLSLLILLLVSPLLLTIALAVKLTSRGPVLFRQKRHGWDGREIEVWKFRSMRLHHEAPGVLTQAAHDDPRLTRLGAFLRRSSLDELPQFFNVLKGAMSIVGPRPHAVEHNAQYMNLIDHYALRHTVKPGITGWAQINGWRGETETVNKMQGRIEHDLYYIEHWSLAFDLRIIALTLLRGFVNKNAY
ncbi:MAG: undecaprenyl-phosphate glucose phosphotransferase [Metallibacterium scheffleri]|uniref:undecaprenyl-phosphate glucose phosphotransferase n=1 Tax=Metallibacterium scheffleri TaxID=993689 RepID=UPI0026F313F0|nr:undecaprenyl-phosphate glucose phosphotransferase [Metallibacterium scheffleri]MCK9367451.1 undecaprenyl-phosphate glucose phosphotransferase [Metallibacterium scheffleri]